MDYQKYIQESGYMKKFIAKEIGVSAVMFSYFLSGKKNLLPEKKMKLHRLLNIK